MNYLVVIDMQEQFYAADNKELNVAVEREIKEAKRKRWQIVFVEYKNLGNTNKNLTDAIGNYKRFTKVMKDYNDGSSVLIRRLKLKSIKKIKIKLCGIYTEYCVFETFEGLHSNLPKANFIIAADACIAGLGGDESGMYEGFERTEIVYGSVKKENKRAA